jgi:hypothetical protein
MTAPISFRDLSRDRGDTGLPDRAARVSQKVPNLPQAQPGDQE